MLNRPGFRTSEFLVSVLTLVGSIVAATQDYITNPQATGLSVAGAVAYVLSRGLAKYEPRPPVDTTPPAK
jgi:hypothetical protein